MTRTKKILAALLSIVLVASVGLAATGGYVGAQTQEDPATVGSASVTIEDQPSDGKTVIVDNVTVPEGGFVVIHDAEELEDGEVVDSVIGVSTYLEPGTHEDVPVTMGQELDSTEVEVTAMAHQDTNGNEVYDFVTSDGEIDGAYTTGGAEETETETEPGTSNETETESSTETETETGTSNETETETSTEPGTSNETETETGTPMGTETPDGDEETGPVVDTATIDAVGNQAPSTNLEFSGNASNESTVTVDRVTLYRGGYVVVHDAEELEDGDAIDSVIGHTGYLPPGTYEDVEITLAEPLDLENDSSVNVTAMPHHETNENLVYDFAVSFGDEDGPYTANGSAVTETAAISEGDENASDGDSETATPTSTETETGTPSETETGTQTATETGTSTETETEAGTETATEGS